MGWGLGTAVGVALGGAIGDPSDFGLDAILPAFFLCLLVEELRSGQAVAAALLAAVISLSLIPVAPVGVPVVASSLAALIALGRRR